MQEDRLKELVKKYAEGNCSADEINLLENAYLDWNEADKLVLSEQQLVEAQKLMRQNVVSHTKPVPVFRLWPKIAVAAAVLIVASFSLLLYYNYFKSNTIVYLTESGQRKTFTLPDGSIVKLNGKSSLSFSTDFNHTLREVTLIGEAYFNVVHNAAKPFVVQTKHFKIKDIGTIFNVKAYEDDRYTETSLIEGAIELTTKGKVNAPVLLLPSQKVIVDNLKQVKEDPAKVKNINANSLKITHITSNSKDKTIIETDWVNNRLAFNNESFGEIAKQLERWYNVSISFENKQVKDYHFVATFDNGPLTDILDVLKSSRNFNYRKEGDLIIIY